MVIASEELWILVSILIARVFALVVTSFDLHARNAFSSYSFAKLHTVLVEVVFYRFIKSQEIKESVPSELRQQVFLLVRPMHQVSTCLPFLILLRG